MSRKPSFRFWRGGEGRLAAVFKNISMHSPTMMFLLKALLWGLIGLVWNDAPPRTSSRPARSSSWFYPLRRSTPGGSSFHTPVWSVTRRRRLEPVQTKRVLCGGVGEDHVRVIEHVQAIERQRVDFQIVQWELGVDIKADIGGQRASQVFGQARGRLSTHWTEARQQRMST